MGTPWGIHGKSMGIPWGIHWESMGHPWDIQGLAPWGTQTLPRAYPDPIPIPLLPRSNPDHHTQTPTQTLPRPYSDPTQTLPRPYPDPTHTPFRPHTSPTHTPPRHHPDTNTTTQQHRTPMTPPNTKQHQNWKITAKHYEKLAPCALRAQGVFFF